MIDLKKAAAALLVAALGLAAPAFADVNVFCYHRFGEARYASTNIATDVFEEQLRLLKEEGYRVLRLSELVRLLETGAPLPQKAAVLTVDDGYRSFATGAVPLLAKYGYPATLFVSPGTVGQGSYLSWEELRQLAAQGIEIANHSQLHEHMASPGRGESPDAWRQRMKTDLEDSQARFRRELGQAPQLFAYPYGEFSPALIALLKEMGFRAAVGQQSGVVFEGSNLYSLPRFPMGGGFATLKGFREKLGMKALAVSFPEATTPLIEGDNPPVLRLLVEEEDADLDRLSCFVQGENRCTVLRNSENSRLLEIRAEKPISTRRNKYTLTAPSRRGAGWYWFSQPWIRPELPE